MQIIVFLDTPFEQFSCDERTLSISHPLLRMIKKRLQRSIEVVDPGSHWELIYQRFGLQTDFSPAIYCAEKLNLELPNVLMATPVRVQLGMRHSQTHFLDPSHFPSKAQIDRLNEYFHDQYFLYQIESDQYLLCSDKLMEHTLDKKYWCPNLSDFTLQMLTTNRRLRKFHTDVQSWCHKEALAWNSLYLWGQGGTGQTQKLHVKAEKNLRNPFAFLHSHEDAEHKIFLVNNLRSENELLTECEFHLNASKNTNIDFVFSDNYSVRISSSDKLSWVKRIFTKKDTF